MIKVVVSPKCETHVPGDSTKVIDLYGMGEHSPGSIPDHMVQSGDGVRIPSDTVLPNDIGIS